MAKRARPSSGRAIGKRFNRTNSKPASAAARSAGFEVVSQVRPTGPSPGATALFEQGMMAMQKHAYADAAAMFGQLLEQHPRERALLDRARLYRDLCERELSRKRAGPQTVEERLTAATAALNNGNDREAERLVRSALAKEPEDDLALYLLAVIEARRGKADTALQFLSQAVAISPEAGAQARHDADFDLLRDNEAFKELTERPPTSAEGNRRSRRSRAGR